MDLTESIAPKSDQLNAEDLLTGPRTFTVQEVRKGKSDEQPFDVHLVEYPGRPFRPSKTVRRILVTAWGKESDAYAGRRLTLFTDPTVRFGGAEVGGIRVSHLSHLPKQLKLALTVTRGKKAPHIVDPLPDAAPAAATVPADRIAPGRVTAIGAALEHIGITTREDKLDALKAAVGRDLTSPTELTPDEGDVVLAWIEAQATPTEQPAGGETPAEDPPGDPAEWGPVAQPGSGGRQTAGQS